MKAFKRKGDAYLAVFTPAEAQMLVQLSSQVAELMSTHVRFDGDPAVNRLLPDAYRGDDEAAAEFRRFTADGLADRKVANARVVIAGLGEAAAADRPTRVSIDPAGAQAWMRTITDIRLSIAARLGIETDDQVLPAGEPLVDIYLWLAFVQDSLVTVLR
jgi:hypothetical protein